MSQQGLPTALILGIDHFVAKKLAEKLVDKDIKVIGVGEMISELTDLKNFDWVMNLDEVEGEFNYIFDFVGDKNDWGKIKGEKFTLISVDNDTRKSYLSREATGLETDWRIVEAKGVYGERMDENVFLTKVIRQAVANKNLELPEPKKTIKLLAIDDLVEAILRACFLSGTNREYFLVLGREIAFEKLAKVLMDKAKMTRFKVMEIEKEIDNGNQKLAEVTEKQLRWEAEIDFEDGIEETLQYFFSLVDEENRRKVKETPKKNEIKILENKHVKIFDVVVDNEEKITEKIEKEPKMVIYDETKTIKEEEDDFDLPSLIKNEETEDWIEEESEEEIKVEVKKEIVKEETIKEKEIKENKKVKKNKFLKYWWLSLIILVIVFLFEPIKWYLVTTKTIKEIKSVPELIKDKKYNQAEKLIEKRTEDLNIIDNKVTELGLNSFVLGRNYQSGLKILMDFLVVEKKLPETAKIMDSINEAVFRDKQIDWTSELDILNTNLVEIENNIGLLQARLSGDYSWLPAVWRSTLQKQTKVLEETRNNISLGKEVINLLPDFLGLDGKKREYIILLQNETELRPTGGFVGSYALLSFQGGKIINFEIKDTGEVSNKTGGQMEPPWEIKTFLNENNWYLRDANWKADFVKASGDTQWFLEKETSKKVDGVMSINLAVAKSMLEVIGEIYIPEFKEKINGDNVYEQAEFYKETKFFPGSVQKISFFEGLGKQLFEEIKNLKMEKSWLMISTFFDLLEKNEIQIALNNKDSAKKINNLGWDGKIYEGKCVKENCVTDYWYLVEANLGVNKANYFIKKGIEEVTEITKMSLNRIIRVNYENTAKNNNWPGGDYKNYVRIYLPKDITLSQISVSDGYDTSIKKIYGNNEITIKEVSGKQEIGFLVTVPVTKKRILEIKYETSFDFGGGKELTYMKYIQKQSGSGETTLVSLISFPDEWQPIQVEPTASIVGGKLLFNMKLDKDIKMGVVLGK